MATAAICAGGGSPRPVFATVQIEIPALTAVGPVPGHMQKRSGGNMKSAGWPYLVWFSG